MGGAVHSIWDTLGSWQMFYIIRQVEAGAGCELGGPRENEQWERKRTVEKRIPKEPSGQQGRRVGSGRRDYRRVWPRDQRPRDLGDEG